MKKRFWTRLTAAVVTSAMAFSILAMPASAADSEWRVGVRRLENDAVWAIWMDEDWLRYAAGSEVEGYNSEQVADFFRLNEQALPLEVNVVDQPFIGTDEFGISEGVQEGDTVYVYKKAELDKITAGEDGMEYFFRSNDDRIENGLTINETTGKLTITIGDWVYDKNEEGIPQWIWETTRKETIPLDHKTTVPGDVVSPAPAPVPSGSGASSSDGGATIMIAAAAGAAAATAGIYLYTHPEVIQDIKDFFAGLAADVQAKVQALTGSVKTAAGLADEAAEQPAAEAPAA